MLISTIQGFQRGWMWFLVASAVPVMFMGSVSQAGESSPSRHVFSQEELDQLLAPIALYPDSLLSQVLMASTYPLEVVEAARWSKAHPEWKGEDAVKAASDKEWDPSVKSLCAFPHVLAVMNEKLEWTERLGDAFLGQEAQVMDTAQTLRRKAQAAGHLTSDERVLVTSQGRVIVVEYVNPAVIYVPYYDPFWAYGPWWWSAYPPYHWDPWPGYAYPSGVRVGFIWGVSTNVRVGFFFGGFDWLQRRPRVRYVHHYDYYYGPRRAPALNVWVHEVSHRRGVPYRHPDAHRRFFRADAPRSPHREPGPPAMGNGRKERETREPSWRDAPGRKPDASTTKEKPEPGNKTKKNRKGHEGRGGGGRH